MKYIWLFLLPALLTGCNPKTSQFHKELRSVADSNGLVGISVVVTQNGNIDDAFHYGKADARRNIPVNNQTMYRIASISKSVTATALMTLYEAGHFKLDDDVSHALGYKLRHPEYPKQPITYRMLLAHTSGLRDGQGYHAFRDSSYQNPGPPAIQLLLQEQGRFFTPDIWGKQPPGSYFTYANLNYGIVGALVEIHSGMRFDRYVKTAILEPLDIEGGFNKRDIGDQKWLATLYRGGKAQKDSLKSALPLLPPNYTPGHNGLIFSPHGGLRVSAEDLAKFMLVHANNGSYKGTRIISEKTARLMREPVWTYNGDNGNKGDVVIPGMRFAGHAGQAYGLISDMYFAPKAGTGIIFITNGYYGDEGYPSGERSAFYMPEEGVYKAIARHYKLNQ